MGADRAIHIWDDALASTDSLGIAKALAAVAKSESFDLIFTGLMSDDANYGLTGPMLAELLGIPHITSVVKTDFKNGEIEVERELEGGALEVASIPQPCLLAVQTGINEVRYASLKGIMQAKKKPFDKKTLGDLGLDAGSVAPKAQIEKVYSPPKGEGAELVQGTPEETASQIVTKIKELGLL
jgi:electron transfer flavoprotein beta subunit